MYSYLKKISDLSKKYHKKYGDIWWCSLIAEKNATKSKTYHRIIKDLPPKKFSLLNAIWYAFRKYCSFLLRCICSNKFSFDKDASNLVFYYSLDTLKHLDLKDYCAISIDKDLYSFFRITDFLYVLLFYFLEFFRRTPKLGLEYREDVLRSFRGDVLIETLFYRKVFRRLYRKSSALFIFYVYEGLAWEKSMLLAFRGGCIRIGYLRSFPSEGILNYIYDPEELSIMPAPDFLSVPGKVPAEFMKRYFGDKVVQVPSRRYAYLKNVKPDEYKNRDFLLVLLSHDKEVSQEMMTWVECNYGEKVLPVYTKMMVKPHPDNDFNFSWSWPMKVNGNIKDLLSISHTVIVHDSSAHIEALAYGCEVVVPNLPSFIDMSPYIVVGAFDVKDYL